MLWIRPRSSRWNAPPPTEANLVLQGQRDCADAGGATLPARAGIDVGLPVPPHIEAGPAFGHAALVEVGTQVRSRGSTSQVPPMLSQDGNSFIVSWAEQNI
jgi:hypothetical protein